MSNPPLTPPTPATPRPAPANTSADLQTPKPLRRMLLVLPLIPLLLALIIALVLRYTQNHPAPKNEINLLGSKAPDFSLRDANKTAGDSLVTLSLLVENKPVLLVFHRGYGCSRCLGMLQALADREELAALQVLVVSPWTVANTRDSIENYNVDLPFPLLCDSDPEDKTARAFGLQLPDGYYQYGVFIVDRQRRIQYAAKTDALAMDMEALIAAGKKLPPAATR